eukprot:Colp12_sorted_trinity150504_noHs@31870
MGNIPSVTTSIYGVIGRKDVRVIFCGLEGAGKTTILERWMYQNLIRKKVELTDGTSTVGKSKKRMFNFTEWQKDVYDSVKGYNMEAFSYKNFKFTVFDLAGSPRFRQLWPSYYQGTRVIVFVFDSADLDRTSEAREELTKLLEHAELKDAILVVLANKQDVKKTMLVHEVTEALNLHSLEGIRKWHVLGTCATKNEGLQEALDWVAKELT